MTNPDKRLEKLADIRNDMVAAFESKDVEALGKALDEYQQCITAEIMSKVDSTVDSIDSNILAARGVRVLTKKETEYYNKIIAASKSSDPKAAIGNISEAFPETIFTEVLEDIRASHPLLEAIDFQNTTAVTKWFINTQGEQEAVWGELGSAITEELEGEIDVVDMTLCKLSAFMYMPNDIIELGPRWIDVYIRSILAESIAVGLEKGIVDGTGKNMPIGMTRDVSDDVVIVSGEYPRKTATPVTTLDPKTVGDILSTLATSPNGKPRNVGTPLFVVNWKDYFKIVFPATTTQTMNGEYAHNVLPYPMRIIPIAGVPEKHAVIGIGKRYFAGVGMSKNGRIEVSTQYKFLEDKTTYKIKTYANGLPKDDNAFAYIDITDLTSTIPTVQNIPVEP